ncbi:MAG: amidase [Planctomycetes bacterium]|nr:amidase [Planctomycetota bacterium]MCH9724703.1 amidase [Planctomycetota bacterium]MCH9778851.1 amidase [Planctomycetota bacterium]MCH9790006.1 amidase [Planctomycetota bacterium]
MNLFHNAPLTIAPIQQAIKTRELSCRELLDTCFQNIEEKEPVLHAWAHINRESAFQQAEELDHELEQGHWRGPLHGIPVGIKDIIDIKGMPTRAGFSDREELPATRDAAIVENLRLEGAIFPGKTVTTQLACFDPPPTRNPWNQAHTPGGSSSGSATAVAAGMCLAAVGTQTGGSIIRPASFCGIAGLKSTFGMIDRKGLILLSDHLDHIGPLAHTVVDLVIMLDSMTDQATYLPLLIEPVTDAPRIGWLTDFFESRADASMQEALKAVRDKLETAGASINDCSLPTEFDTILEYHLNLMQYEMAQNLGADYDQKRGTYGPAISQVLDAGKEVSQERYTACLDYQSLIGQVTRRCFARSEILISPATLGPAPDLSTTGDPSMNAPWSLTGFPTISIPFSVTKEGMPLAIQITGHPDKFDDLLLAAQWCEDVLRPGYLEQIAQ